MADIAAKEMEVRPLLNSQGSLTNFGASVRGVDLNNLNEADFLALKKALYTHSVLVIKDQHDLLPAKQFDLNARFDPDAQPTHGLGYGKTLKELGNLAKKPFYSIPGSGGVTLVGDGYQGEDHFGLKNLSLSAISHVDFHADPLTDAELASGQARFVNFHFDGIIYGSHPSRVTTFRCVRTPKGPNVTVSWNDISPQAISCPPGSTAFISTAQLYNLLTDEEKTTADNSYWQPAPHPFAWTGSRRVRSSGLGMAATGQTLPLEDLPEWSSDKVYKYPMVWLSPVTGERCFQMFPEVTHKLYLKDPPLGPERLIEDYEEIRVWLNEVLDRIAKPEYIMVPPCEEGDVVIWNNWGVLHSAIEFPASYGSRSMHQCRIASSTAPVGPATTATG